MLPLATLTHAHYDSCFFGDQHRKSKSMFAVIRIGGRKYRVSPNAVLKVDKLQAEPGATVTFTDVLEVGSEGNLTIGSPVLADALVAATVLAQERPDESDTAKKHRRNSRRQTATVLRVASITAGGKTFTAEPTATSPSAESAAVPGAGAISAGDIAVPAAALDATESAGVISGVDPTEVERAETDNTAPQE
jgi:large subunit ribosomal protein L21